MPPIAGFIIGVLLSELSQWGLWIVGHKDAPKLGYWKDGVGHFLTAWSTCAFIGLLWAWGALDMVTGWLPDAITGQWADTGVPYTPQVGMMVGLGINFMADKIAWVVRSRFGAAPAPEAKP